MLNTIFLKRVNGAAELVETLVNYEVAQRKVKELRASTL